MATICLCRRRIRCSELFLYSSGRTHASGSVRCKLHGLLQTGEALALSTDNVHSMQPNDGAYGGDKVIQTSIATGKCLNGHCLCGTVEFEIAGDRFNLYQCHCSLCRRQGGSLSNAATIVPNNRFRWLRGEECISSWKNERGFRSDFCATCGSPVPNPLRKQPYVWVPAGLLENSDKLQIVAHLCTASRAAWDSSLLEGACYDELPDLSAFIALIVETGA